MEKITDIEGNTYKTVKIGEQKWIAQNLNVNHFRNGDPIQEARTFEEWTNAGEKGKPAWCYYENDPEKGKIYGKLYNWFAINDSRGLAPKGWHIPEDYEWSDLTDHLGGRSVAGGRLKESGTIHWNSPNEGANNKSGFTALPGGYRWDNDGSFRDIGKNGNWWSATDNYNKAWSREMGAAYGEIDNNIFNKNNGFSVRCVKD